MPDTRGMKSIFEHDALPWLFEVEGGLNDDAADRGGITKYGISLRYLKNVPDHDGDGFLDGDIDKDGDVDADDIRALSPADAIARYEQDFWLAANCDQFPRHVALCLFDSMVNHRPGTAKRLIQRGLSVKPDGVIGPLTRKAAASHNQYHFLNDHFSYRCVFYRDISIKHPGQAKWLRGWLRRTHALHQYILTGELP